MENETKNIQMEIFKNRRDAILEICTLNNESDLIIFMGRMVKTMQSNVLTNLDCDMIADELSMRFNVIQL
jgi:hypothetical protein